MAIDGLLNSGYKAISNKLYYNGHYIDSKVRMVVQNAIYRLKEESEGSYLLKCMDYCGNQYTSDVIAACVVLHNIFMHTLFLNTAKMAHCLLASNCFIVGTFMLKKKGDC